MKTENVRRVETAIGRAIVNEFLSRAFAYPDGPRVEELRAQASQCLVSGVSLPIMRLAAIAHDATREYLEPVYAQLTTFTSSPDCATFETAYFGSDAQQQTQRMADIAGFYRAFGVDATCGGFRPDELSVELEFMAFLALKEAFAEEHLGAPRAGQARKAQRLFLEEHLGRWGAVFGQRFAAGAPAGHFYSLLGETLSAWLAAESERNGARPVQVAGDTPAVWPSPVSHGPEFAGEASFIPAEDLV